jgi:uncharacterized repeat protein (TIGR01451 family)
MLRFGLPVCSMQRRNERGRIRRRSHFFRPSLLVLEDRLAPAAFTVNTFSDTHAVNLLSGADKTGHVSLRSAIEAADHLGGGNSIRLPAGSYQLSLGQLEIQNNLTLTGAGAATTLIDAGLMSRIFHIPVGWMASISDVTLKRGMIQGSAVGVAGGGAVLDFGMLTLTNDTITGNLALGGNGANGAPGANGATGPVAGNGAPGGSGQRGGDAEGGAVFVDPGAQLTILNCVLSQNAASQGQGGTGGPGGNGADGGASFGGAGAVGGAGGPGGSAYGGAVYNAGGILVVHTSLFSQNSAGLSSFLLIGSGGTGGPGGSGGGGFPGNDGGAGGPGGSCGLDVGGAIYNSGPGSATIVATSFAANTALGEVGGPGGVGGEGGPSGYISGKGGVGGTGGSAGESFGGAISNLGTMNIDNCSFFKNQAVADGAGLGGNGGAGGNGAPIMGGGAGGNGGPGSAGFAGAIGSGAGSLLLTHSTVSLNTARSGIGGAGGSGGMTGRMGGVSGSPGVAGPPGHAAGGGLENVFGLPKLFDTIVAGDTAPGARDVNGTFVSLGHNLIGDRTGGTGFTGPGDQVGTTANPINPRLRAPGNYGGPTPTMVPLFGSPAIDAGDNTNAPPTDQRGLPRVVDSDSNIDQDGPVIDIGAVEFQPTNVSIAATASPRSVSAGGTLTYTITVSTSTGDNDGVLNLTLSDPLPPPRTTFLSFAAPAGWTLSTPAVGDTGTVKATASSLASNTKASFTLAVKVGTLPAGSTLSNTVTITTTSPQPTSSGKMATVKIRVTQGDSLVALAGPLSLTAPVTFSPTDPAPAKAPTTLAGPGMVSVTVRAETLPSAEAHRSPAALGRELHLPGDFWSDLDDWGKNSP